MGIKEDPAGKEKNEREVKKEKTAQRLEGGSYRGWRRGKRKMRHRKKGKRGDIMRGREMQRRKI